MFSRPRSFSVLYGIQRSFLTVFYLISAVAVFWLVFYLLHEVLNAGGSLIVPVSLAYLVLIVLGYSLIHVISYIPANLAGAFDPLKNGIADRTIDSAGVLSGKLADFMCSFFNFAFFDVLSAMVQLSGNEPVTSSDSDQTEWEANRGKIETFAGTIEETSFYGKISTPGGAGYLYVIPLIFGETRLGYIAITTRQKLWRIFVSLLNEFENDFVDDQVVHVLANEASAVS